MASKSITISGFTVLIDEEDEHILSMGAWRVIDKPRNRYVKLNRHADGKLVTLYLHRVIAGAGPGQTVDHINGNALDNRRENLRLVGLAQNARNRMNHAIGSSRFKGVSAKGSRWRMQIRVDGRRISREFDSEAEAAYHYDLISLESHGEFGRRNFLPLL